MLIRKMVGQLVRQSQQQMRRLRNVGAVILEERYILGAWYQSENWGDALNPFLLEAISGKKAIHYKDVFPTHDAPVYSVIGSVIGLFDPKDLVVWGSGFISSEATITNTPNLITAVRGPKTRRKLLKLGIQCPSVYGDPALLLPRFLHAKPGNRRYKLGIIPHYIDKAAPIIDQFEHYDDDVLIIDICSGIPDVVNAICNCDMVASSSLHGLICADAYGVPNVWLEFSDKIVGGRFKFFDYLLSVGRFEDSPLAVTCETSVEEILNHCRGSRPDIDLESLWAACPFRP